MDGSPGGGQGGGEPAGEIKTEHFVVAEKDERQRKTANLSWKGRPKLFFPKSSIVIHRGPDGKEGPGIGQPQQVFGGLEFDWAGIHMNDIKMEEILKGIASDGDNPNDARVVAAAFRNCEVTSLCEGKASIFLLRCPQVSRFRLGEILGRVDWSELASDRLKEEGTDPWGSLDLMVQQFASNWGLKACSTSREVHCGADRDRMETNPSTKEGWTDASVTTYVNEQVQRAVQDALRQVQAGQHQQQQFMGLPGPAMTHHADVNHFQGGSGVGGPASQHGHQSTSFVGQPQPSMGGGAYCPPAQYDYGNQAYNTQMMMAHCHDPRMLGAQAHGHAHGPMQTAQVTGMPGDGRSFGPVHPAQPVQHPQQMHPQQMNVNQTLQPAVQGVLDKPTTQTSAMIPCSPAGGWPAVADPTEDDVPMSLEVEPTQVDPTPTTQDDRTNPVQGTPQLHGVQGGKMNKTEPHCDDATLTVDPQTAWQGTPGRQGGAFCTSGAAEPCSGVAPTGWRKGLPKPPNEKWKTQMRTLFRDQPDEFEPRRSRSPQGHRVQRHQQQRPGFESRRTYQRTDEQVTRATSERREVGGLWAFESVPREASRARLLSEARDAETLNLEIHANCSPPLPGQERQETSISGMVAEAASQLPPSQLTTHQGSLELEVPGIPLTPESQPGVDFPLGQPSPTDMVQDPRWVPADSGSFSQGGGNLMLNPLDPADSSFLAGMESLDEVGAGMYSALTASSVGTQSSPSSLTGHDCSLTQMQAEIAEQLLSEHGDACEPRMDAAEWK